MNIEDVKVGMKVKIVSSHNTEEHLGYDEDDMSSLGDIGIVANIIADYYLQDYVLLEGGEFFDIRDLEAVEDAKEKLIGNLTVNISTEDKQEIAKDILKIVLNDFNKVITDAIQSLSEIDRNKVAESTNSIGFADTYDMLDEKMHKLLDEVIKEIFKEQLLEVTKQFNKQAFN